MKTYKTMRIIAATALLALIATAPLLWADTSTTRGSTGVTTAVGDGRYGSLAGEAAWAGAQNFTLATLLAKAATADAHVVNRLFGDGRYFPFGGGTITGNLLVDGDTTLGDVVGDGVTCNAGIVTFPNVTTLNLDAATTVDATGFTVLFKGTTYDFATNVTNVTVPPADAGTEAMNRDASDARYAVLSGPTFTGVVLLADGGVAFASEPGTIISLAKAGRIGFTFGSVLTTTFDAAGVVTDGDLAVNGGDVILGALTTFTVTDNDIVLDTGTGQTLFKSVHVRSEGTGGYRVDPVTDRNATLLSVDVGTTPTLAWNEVLHRFVFDEGVLQPHLKSGTVAGGSFAGNPKVFTVTFNTAFPDANYAVTIAAEDNRTFTFQTKLAGSFVMNSNANLALVGDVDWIATAHNDP